MKEFSTLEVQAVGMTFSQGEKTVEALQGVSMSIPRGQFAALVGASGCGKSTLLRIIAGLETPTKGQITLRMPDDTEEAVEAPSRDRAMVFQSYTSFPWLTVRQNLEFPLRLGHSGKDRERQAADVDKFLDLTGLMDFASQFPDTLSGGMRQRVAIARTLVNEPGILLMDEPFGALDAQTRWQMQDLLLEVRARTGCTVIFVTHDVEEAVYLADRVFVFSPRPGTIKAEMDVKLPERTSNVRLSDGFKKLQVDILSIITESVLKAAETRDESAEAGRPTTKTIVDKRPPR